MGAYSVTSKAKSKQFRIELTSLHRVMDGSSYVRAAAELSSVRIPGMEQSVSTIQKIILDELKDLSEHVILPVFREYAPVKVGGNTNSKYEWKIDERDQLRNLLKTRRSSDNFGLEIVMPFKGQATITGRPALPGRGKPYRIELPGGQVVYSFSTRAATILGVNSEGEKDAAAAAKRMAWVTAAADYLRKGNWYSQLAKNISARAYLEVFFGRDERSGEYTIPLLSTPQSRGSTSKYQSLRRYARDRSKAIHDTHIRRSSALKGRSTRIEKQYRSLAEGEHSHSSGRAQARLLTRLEHNERVLGIHSKLGEKTPSTIPLGRNR